MMVEVFVPYLFEMAGRMQKLLPDKPRDEPRLHFMLSVNNLFRSLADIDLLRRTLGSEEGGKMSSKRFREESDKLFKQYLDFQIYGMAGKYLK